MSALQSSTTVNTPNLNGYSFLDTNAEPPEINDGHLTFLSRYTGIDDLDVLRKGVIEVWREAREKHHVYKCIETFMFLIPAIQFHPSYRTLLNTLSDRQSSHQPAPYIADVGCCFGTDVRRLIYDGVPAENIVGVDLHDGYWNIGKRLFEDGERIEGVKTVWRDMASGEEGAVEREGLKGRFDFVVAMAVLHVFSKEQQRIFLANILQLLTPGGT
ncbi:hypothetical protein HK097_003769, partial [Rhizophlyctis rosea]